MTCSQTVFELAIHLMDEANLATGAADTSNTREYKNRTIPILNVLRVECFPFSDTYPAAEDGKRPVCPVIETWEEPIPLDDALCQGVLPYGLAAHLLLGEDDHMASFFQQRYEEQLAMLGRSVPAGSGGDVQDLYGGIEFGQFSRW